MVFRFPSVFLLAALCLLSLYNVNAFNPADWPKLERRISSFSWKDCGPSSDPAQIQSITVIPDPIKLPGNITVSTTFSLSASSPDDVSVELTLEKKIAGFYVKIPCIDNVGSCTYKGVCADWAKVCPTYFAKYGLPCTCPFPAKSYSISDASFAIDQSIPGIGDGDYRATANLVSTTGGHIVCLELELTLSK